MKLAFTLAILVAPALSAAQPAIEVPSAVKTFETVCLAGGVDASARPAALAAAGWKKDSSTTVDVPRLSISRAIAANYDFSKPDRTEQWSGTIDGKGARIVLAAFPAKRRYPQLCAMIVDGVRNAMPYGGDLRDAFKRFGIGGKSVDLVHYFEFAGKVGADKHPVRGEIFSRSQASGAPDSMHIYIAY